MCVFRKLSLLSLLSFTDLRFISKYLSQEVIGASPTPKINKSTMDRFCARCREMVYLMERLQVEGRLFHRACFRCFTCDTQLRMGTYRYIPAEDQFYCDQHYRIRTTSPSMLKPKFNKSLYRLPVAQYIE